MAHGANPGKKASIFDFRDLINAAIDKHPDTVCVIAHSLGAAAASLAVSEGLTIPSFISLGAPVVGEDILDVFVQRVNGSSRNKAALRAECQRSFNRDFDDVTMAKTFSSLQTRLFWEFTALRTSMQMLAI